MLLMFIIEITKCITKSPKIGIIPFVIGIPTSVIGIEAKSAIIIEIASSNGCNCPISLFPINLITTKTSMYNTIVLIKVIIILKILSQVFNIILSQNKKIIHWLNNFCF